MKWPSDKNLNKTKRVQKNKNANGARKEMAHYVLYIKGFKRDWYLCRGLWLRYRRHSRVRRATSATKSKNVHLTQRSLNQIMRIVNFRRILLKKKMLGSVTGGMFY